MGNKHDPCRFDATLSVAQARTLISVSFRFVFISSLEDKGVRPSSARALFSPYEILGVRLMEVEVRTGAGESWGSKVGQSKAKQSIDSGYEAYSAHCRFTRCMVHRSCRCERAEYNVR